MIVNGKSKLFMRNIIIMKKFIFLAAIIGFSVATLCSCGNSNSGNSNSDNSNKEEKDMDGQGGIQYSRKDYPHNALQRAFDREV